MEGVRCLAEGLPVAEKGSIRAVAWDEIVSCNHKGEASGANIFLRARVDNTVLGPVDGLSAEIARHIADESLASRDLLEGELCELEALDGLVVTVMEKLGISIDVPVGWLGDGRVAVALIVSNFVGCAVLLGLLDGAL